MKNYNKNQKLINIHDGSIGIFSEYINPPIPEKVGERWFYLHKDDDENNYPENECDWRAFDICLF